MGRTTGAAALKTKLAQTDPEAQATPSQAKENAPKKRKSAAPTTDLVRLSVDIRPVPYRNLMNFCQDVALEIGRVRVQHVWVMRAVLAELLEDKELQKRVIERVEEEHGPHAK
jgi:hypothetical protein